MEARNAGHERSEQSTPIFQEINPPKADSSVAPDAQDIAQDGDVTQIQQNNETAGAEPEDAVLSKDSRAPDTSTIVQDGDIIQTQQDLDTANAEFEDATVPKESHAPEAPAIVQDGGITQNEQSTENASAPLEDAGVAKEKKPNLSIRLYASKNRMWHAVAGHGPDSNRVKSLDFICLSIVAASGPKGIIQHDLVKISGQDKRSLPARTDRLHKDGYVEKKQVSVQLFNPTRVLHTSKCTLKRFVNDVSHQKQNGRDRSPSPVVTARRGKKKVQKAQDSLVAEQVISTKALEDFSKKKENTIVSESRPIPSWIPDRSINNQIFELVDQAGIKGISMTVRFTLRSLHDNRD